MKISVRIETTREGIDADTFARMEAIQLLTAIVSDIREGKLLSFGTKDGVTAAAFEIYCDELPIVPTGTNGRGMIENPNVPGRT